MSEGWRNLGKVLGVVAAASGAVEAQSQRERPGAGIEYSHDDRIHIKVTPGAQKMLAGFGYRFPIKDGKISMCRRVKDCINVNDELTHPNERLTVDIRDIDTEEGKEVLMCRIFTQSDGADIPKIFIFDRRSNQANDTGFIEIDEDSAAMDELVEECFPEVDIKQAR